MPRILIEHIMECVADQRLDLDRQISVHKAIYGRLLHFRCIDLLLQELNLPVILILVKLEKDGI